MRSGAAISRTCSLARYLESKVLAAPELELLAPVPLNIVCFRVRGSDANQLNADIVADLHESGIVAPSTTTIDGAIAIRAAIVNHRTSERESRACAGGHLFWRCAVAARAPHRKAPTNMSAGTPKSELATF